MKDVITDSTLRTTQAGEQGCEAGEELEVNNCINFVSTRDP